jgi:hypothetical protein
VLSAEDVKRSVNGHREVIVGPQAVVTPLAADQLRMNGVRISRQQAEEKPAAKVTWGYVLDKANPLATSAVRSLERDGLTLKELQGKNEGPVCRWAKAVAECVAQGGCIGCVVFCEDSGLVCCVANKLAGLRAAAIASTPQAARAVMTFGPNLVAIEMSGRTFFELRQILKTICGVDRPLCPDDSALTLQELDGHAHR